MILVARPLISLPSQRSTVRLWVGLFGIENPQVPTFFLGATPASQAPANPAPGEKLYPIDDGVTNAAKKPLNHQGVFTFARLGAGINHCLRIVANGVEYSLAFVSQPDAVPANGAPLNVLLTSCYYQPNGDDKALESAVAHLPSGYKPHLSLMVGDQVYLDVPVIPSWRFSLEGVQKLIGQKYYKNWCSDTLGTGGLQSVLRTAPTACIPDDHEFWNNYPLDQFQLPPLAFVDKQDWSDTAMDLYAGFQLGGPAKTPQEIPGFQRIEVDPLIILLLDTRTRRDDTFNRLMPDDAAMALQKWADDLILAKQNNAPKVGVLSAGQPLFTKPPGDFSKKYVDADLANYQQFELIEVQLERLASQGIPVAFLTGDVHWSRVCAARHGSQPTPMLYEVICSPSTMIPRGSLSKITLDTLRGKDWPGYPEAPEEKDLTNKFGSRNSFVVSRTTQDNYFQCNGNQIAVLQFTRSGFGLDMKVTFFGVSNDSRLKQPKSTANYLLRFY
ncbi:hypothetical protein ACIOYV_07155 [Pseudomonas sp. NPDC087342]|uniref:hypothetical protein n=1 Tax=Pseudomonas sp. NPDC087342 TaxID=3364437 RepID=UPI00380D053D